MVGLGIKTDCVVIFSAQPFLTTKMELPHLGKHCSEETCNLLVFLPIKCDACEKIFCKDHFTYSHHNCPALYKKNRQVPVCPLCNQCIPVNRNELPDIRVSEHMDRDCQLNPKQNKLFINKCSSTGCKRKELMPLKCDGCKQNFCLKHRHAQDHDCQRFSHSNLSINQAGAAAMARMKTNQNVANSKNYQKCSKSSIQPSMNEDEELARALQMSMLDATPQTSQSEDELLAKALAESEKEYRKQRHKRDSSCVLS